tara:strand:+ start:130 stop:807 length:678 start_codon:yes stop_codon:yes gene_type:complete
MSQHWYIDVHTHLSDNELDVLSLVSFDYTQKIHEDQVFSVGSHPWYSSYSAQIEVLGKKSNCLAIGECGLDKLRGEALHVQLETFKKQIQVAEQIGKPVIIHVVKAFDELFKVHQDFSPTQAWIIHGFNKSEQLATQFLDKGFYLSFGEALLKSKSVQDYFAKIPDNQFFLETDDSDISIKKVYEKAAQLKNVSLETLQELLSRNFKAVFHQDGEKLVRTRRVID